MARGLTNRLAPARSWMGWPYWVLAWLLGIGLLGTVGAMVSAGLAMIPIIGLVALIFLPFVNLAAYAAPTLGLGLLLRLLLGLVAPAWLAQWLSVAIAVTMVGWAAFALPQAWNRGAGIQPAAAPRLPAPVTLAPGAAIAMIEQGPGDHLEWRRCESLCQTLLIEGKASAVLVAESPRLPQPGVALPAMRFTLRPDSFDCLASRKPPFAPSDPLDFAKFGSNYADDVKACIPGTPARLDPGAQVTLVNWDKRVEDNQRSIGTNGFMTIMTITPVAGTRPRIARAQFRSGMQYQVPLRVWPFAGNASTGGFFALNLETSYFEDKGRPDDVMAAPVFWTLVSGAMPMGDRLRGRLAARQSVAAHATAGVPGR